MWPWDFSQGLFSQIISNFPERGILRKALPDHSEIKEEEIHNYIWKNKYSSAWKNFKVLVTWSCPTLCNLMNSSPPGSSVHGILQARTLEWAAIPFSSGSSWLRDWTRVSCIAGRFFTIWAPGKPNSLVKLNLQSSLLFASLKNKIHFLPELFQKKSIAFLKS